MLAFFFADAYTCFFSMKHRWSYWNIPTIGILWSPASEFLLQCVFKIKWNMSGIHFCTILGWPNRYGGYSKITGDSCVNSHLSRVVVGCTRWRRGHLAHTWNCAGLRVGLVWKANNDVMQWRCDGDAVVTRWWRDTHVILRTNTEPHNVYSTGSGAQILKLAN